MKWISVKDRLPALGERVLGVDQFFEIQAMHREKTWKDEPEIWYIVGMYIFYPTHWMPLPEAPHA